MLFLFSMQKDGKAHVMNIFGRHKLTTPSTGAKELLFYFECSVKSERTKMVIKLGSCTESCIVLNFVVGRTGFEPVTSYL